MKSIMLFCTKMRFFLGEIPLIYLLFVSIKYNGAVKSPLKLYPLIIFSVAAIIFIAVYFFRAIRISYSEIRYIGRFSSRDSAVINKGKTLILKFKGHNTVKVELFGNDGTPPIFPAVDGDDTPVDINLFRGSVIGGERAVKKILTYFGTSRDEAIEIIASESTFNYENVNISSLNGDDGPEIRIFMKKTV